MDCACCWCVSIFNASPLTEWIEYFVPARFPKKTEVCRQSVLGVPGGPSCDTMASEWVIGGRFQGCTLVFNWYPRFRWFSNLGSLGCLYKLVPMLRWYIFYVRKIENPFSFSLPVRNRKERASSTKTNIIILPTRKLCLLDLWLVACWSFCGLGVKLEEKYIWKPCLSRVDRPQRNAKM